MSEPRIIVSHDLTGTNKWLVAVDDGTGRQINAVPYDGKREDDPADKEMAALSAG
jgi:hypothetical protein